LKAVSAFIVLSIGAAASAYVKALLPCWVLFVFYSYTVYGIFWAN